MISEKQIRQIEGNIKRKIREIKSGKISIEESKISIQFNALETYDPVSYEKMLKIYNQQIQR